MLCFMHVSVCLCGLLWIPDFSSMVSHTFKTETPRTLSPLYKVVNTAEDLV